MKRSSFIIVILITFGIVGIVTYLAQSHTEEFDTQPHVSSNSSEPAGAPSTSNSTTATSAPAIAKCFAAPKDSAQHPISELDARHLSALSLASKNDSDGVLRELRDIASIDPGYPGINLEISDVLLKSKRASEADDAIEVQLEISGCLSNLSENEVQAYCRSQSTSFTPEACHSQLSRIFDRTAQQAALVRMELEKLPASHSTQPGILSSATPHSLASPPLKDGIPSAKTLASSHPPGPLSASGIEHPAAPRPPTAPSLTAIKTTEASAHIGERAKVCGVVMSKKYSEDANGKPTFINLDHPFPEPAFTVLVWGNDLPQTGDLPDSGELCVTGTVVVYRGTPEIVVHDAKGWSRGAQP